MASDKKRPGVLVYFDIEPALDMLDDAKRGRLFTAIVNYAHYGSIPDFNDSVLDMAWAFVKASIDRDGDNYQKTVQKRKIGGITSDFKKNYAPKHGIDPNDEEALREYISIRMSNDAGASQQMSTRVDTCQPTTTTTTTRTTTTTPTTTTTTTENNKGDANNANDPVAVVLSDYLNRINPTASPSSLDELRSYAEDMGKDVCIRAFDIALDNKKTTWPYIRAILRDKLQRGVKCLADWDALEAEREKAKPGHKNEPQDYGDPEDFYK